MENMQISKVLYKNDDANIQRKNSVAWRRRLCPCALRMRRFVVSLPWFDRAAYGPEGGQEK
jgi:hypothetical protein